MSGKSSILLIEDEANLRHTIALNLEMEGYRVVALERAPHIKHIIGQQHFDLIILDIMLPEVDGIDLCKMVRYAGYTLPILMLSAKTEGRDRVTGIKAGADDYMVKPFELDELLFRVRKLLQGEQKNPLLPNKEIYPFCAQYLFHTARLEVYKLGEERTPYTRLSKREALLLKLLLDNKNIFIAREQMLHFVWGHIVFMPTRTIDNFILKFRKLFEPQPSTPIYFISKRSIGYAYMEAQAE